MDDETRGTNEAHENGKGSSPETMFDSLKVAAGDLAERAGPTVRDISARAADLTATAADKAAPFARRAGAATADASVKLAEAARGWAAELRSARSEPAPGETYETSSESATSTATAVAEPPIAERPVVEEVAEDIAPSGFTADAPAVAEPEAFEPPAETEPAPFESTAEGAPATPAFEEGTGTNEEQDRPGF
jgi:hypothetical protein